MIRDHLRDFIDGVTGKTVVSADDMGKLQGAVKESGIAARQEAEALLAIYRNVEDDGDWREVVASLVVEFVMRKAGPRGNVGGEEALWLTTVLDLCGPGETAMTVALAVLDRANHVDAILLDFIMRGRQHARSQSLAA